MEKIEKLIYKQLDSKLTEAEELELNSLLENNEGRLERDKILAVRGSVASVRKNSFKPMFKERVMEQLLVKEHVKNGFSFIDELILSSKKVILTAAAVVLLMISYNIVTTDNLTIETVFGVPEITLEDSYNSVVYSYYGDDYE